MDYPTVSIGSHDYKVYADQESADLYLDASINAAAQSWRAAEVALKARALVSATRWLDSVAWQGKKTVTDQALLWPRSGITDVATDTLPGQLVAACTELAAALVDDNDARADLSSPMIKSQKAGSVTLDYFRPEGGTQVQTPFPQSVMALISQWLAGTGAVSGVLGFDTENTSDLLDDKYDFSHGL